MMNISRYIKQELTQPLKDEILQYLYSEEFNIGGIQVKYSNQLNPIVDLKCVPIHTWLDIDERVGLYALKYKDKYVAVYFNMFRKTPYTIRWISKIKAEEVKDYLLSLIKFPDSLDIKTLDEIELIDLFKFCNQVPDDLKAIELKNFN